MPVPLFKVTVCTWGLHCAKSVNLSSLPDGCDVNVLPALYEVPEPSAAVFQPVKLQPVLVNPFCAIVTVSPYFTGVPSVEPPSFPLPLYATFRTFLS